MNAEKLLLETDTRGNLINIPKLPANKKVEVIILIMDDGVETNTSVSRKPHGDIYKKLIVKGDIINTISENSWDLPQ